MPFRAGRFPAPRLRSLRWPIPQAQNPRSYTCKRRQDNSAGSCRRMRPLTCTECGTDRNLPLANGLARERDSRRWRRR